MGTLKEGVFGGFSGRVGKVVGASWRDIYYIRSLPSKVNDPKTEKQIKQRSRFSVVMEFMKTITPFIRIGFQSHASGRLTAFNSAMSYNMKNAVQVASQGVELDYPNVLVSRGDLDAATGIQAEVSEGELRVSWDSGLSRSAPSVDIQDLKDHMLYKAGLSVSAPAGDIQDQQDRMACTAGLSGNARADDIAMMVVHNRAKKESLYTLNAGKRGDETVTLPLPTDWLNDEMHGYLAFKTADGAHVSDSVHVNLK